MADLKLLGQIYMHASNGIKSIHHHWLVCRVMKLAILVHDLLQNEHGDILSNLLQADWHVLHVQFL
jgi:hypothetical protein